MCKLLLVLGHFPSMLVVEVLFSFFFIFISFYLFTNRGEGCLLAGFGRREGAGELRFLALRSVECSEVVGAAWTKHLDFSVFLLVEVGRVFQVTAVALFFLFNLIRSTTLIHFAFDDFDIPSP